MFPCSADNAQDCKPSQSAVVVCDDYTCMSPEWSSGIASQSYYEVSLYPINSAGVGKSILDMDIYCKCKIQPSVDEA